jgi:hypothetical protein
MPWASTVLYIADRLDGKLGPATAIAGVTKEKVPFNRAGVQTVLFSSQVTQLASGRFMT